MAQKEEEESPRDAYNCNTVQVRKEYGTLKRNKILNKAFQVNIQSIKNAKTNVEMRDAIKLPIEQDEDEWLYCNVIQLFDETISSYQQCHSFCTQQTCQEMTAGVKYKFLWSDKPNTKPYNLSAPQYIYKLFEWIDDELSILSKQDPLPQSFKNKVCIIMRRLLRVYGHIYYCHADKLQLIGLNKEINQTFYHLVFFILEFKLCTNQQLGPIQTLIDKIQAIEDKKK